MYPAVLLMYFISAAVILLASLALIVQVSLTYNNTGRASVLYNFILVFLRVFCDLKTLFKIPVIFKYLCNLSSTAIPLQAWTGPGGFQEVEVSRFQDNRHKNVSSLSALFTGRLYPQKIFLVLISVRG